ncbi:hypothetical protein CORC01_14181 [Colletotrichum orchidophilum]|uniref:Uncharacterized protein n=1 Tax=Colletotrichum orchidophilum TaxID=1209926 RepID=A0A1G4AMX4_9PEZI|nr:uncharacterized protein CORC01_14181 [Colletotrichum orchidophilum]OHE90529.1 hypothetical protein CORC01_14181 [Colletotrichum orchidophilum]
MRQASFTAGRVLPAILRQRHTVSKDKQSRYVLPRFPQQKQDIDSMPNRQGRHMADPHYAASQHPAWLVALASFRVIHFVPTWLPKVPLRGSRFLGHFVRTQNRAGPHNTNYTHHPAGDHWRASHGRNLLRCRSPFCRMCALASHHIGWEWTEMKRDSDLHFHPQLMATASHREKALCILSGAQHEPLAVEMTSRTCLVPFVTKSTLVEKGSISDMPRVGSHVVAQAFDDDPTTFFTH